MPFVPGPPPYPTAVASGAAELLAARGFSVLLMMSEPPEPAWLDQVHSHAASHRVAAAVLTRAAEYIAQALLRPSTDRYPDTPGEPQMAINALRAAELMGDDSNMRGALTGLLAPLLAPVLASEPAVFESRWCGGESRPELLGDHARYSAAADADVRAPAPPWSPGGQASNSQWPSWLP
jgi:hypothetical protein